MSKSSKKDKQQATAFRRAVEAYWKLRSPVILKAIDWYKAHGYESAPIPPIDRKLAEATRTLVEAEQKAVGIRDGDASSGRGRAKRR